MDKPKFNVGDTISFHLNNREPIVSTVIKTYKGTSCNHQNRSDQPEKNKWFYVFPDTVYGKITPHTGFDEPVVVCTDGGHTLGIRWRIELVEKNSFYHKESIRKHSIV